MIDIHTHILPGIDDGSINMKDSIRMARMSYECGVKALVVTPHCNIENMFENYYDDVLVKHFHELCDEIAKEEIPLEIYLGMEVYATEEVPSFLYQGKVTTINHSRYLLMEFDFREDPLLIDFLISEITLLGVTPIIAHPERYPYIQRHPERLIDWTARGCLMQVNKGSVMGNFGSKSRDTAKYLLDHRMVDFIASDAHSPLQRTTDLTRVYQYICNNYSEAYARVLMEENPRRVIDNREVIKAQQKELQSTILTNYPTKRGKQ